MIKAPRTVVQFRDRLRAIRACYPAQAETHGKTLLRAWRETTSPGYLYYWLVNGMRVNADRAYRILNASGQLFPCDVKKRCDFIRGQINHDGTSVRYQLAKARMAGSPRANRRKRR